jgi:hypothetical protein
MSPAVDHIEREAVGMIGDAGDELVALTSIAISLKRIADALHYQPAGTNFYDLVAAIGGRE